MAKNRKKLFPVAASPVPDIVAKMCSINTRVLPLCPHQFRHLAKGSRSQSCNEYNIERSAFKKLSKAVYFPCIP